MQERQIVVDRSLLTQKHFEEFTSWQSWPVSPSLRRAVDEHKCNNPEVEIVLGLIDNDGRLLEKFGPLPGWVSVSDKEFFPRYHFPLAIVLIDGKVLIRKDFQGDKRRFLNEWHNLSLLHGEANVPAVYKVDEKQTVLYKNLIVGQTLRDILVQSGAKITNAQTQDDPSFIGLTVDERIKAVLARGTNHLHGLVGPSFFSNLENQIDAIHFCGVVKLSLTFGNIMVDHENRPWLIDFEQSKAFPSVSSPLFMWQRDRDRQKYNQIYGQSILTETEVRLELSSLESVNAGQYAPIDFGAGVTLGDYWSIDSGTGRWNYLNKEVMKPIILGKRIIDLGSHNGVMPLSMLRDGAEEVIGLELDPKMVEAAKKIQRIFEWRDMRKYSLAILQNDMRAILDHDWGLFDIVTAFCSLYYLPEEDMAKVVQKAAALSPVMILQAKTDTRSDAGENKAIKSSISFLKLLLEKNGYPKVEIVAPKGYSRPLLIGRK